MSNPHAKSDFSSLIKRRRALAMASTALGVAGCAAFQSASSSSQSTQSAPAQQRQVVADKVSAYEADIISALDKVDRDRLRAAAEKQTTLTPMTTTTAPLVVTTAPAPTTGAPVSAGAQGTNSTAQTPIVQASAAHADTGQHAVEPAPVVVPPHTPETSEPVKVATAAIPQPPATTIMHPAPAPVIAEKPPEKAAPPTDKPTQKTVAESIAEASATPLSADSATAVHTAVIEPVVAPTPSAASAMGAMNAVASIQNVSALPAAPVTGVPEAADPSLQDALAVLKKDVGTHPTLSTSLALALLDSSSAPDAAKGLSESDQKVFNDLLTALDTMKTATPPSADNNLAARAAPLLDAAKKWQADADLTLPRLVLASRVDSFGVFTAMDPVFEQGKRHTVIIYCEVANFASEKGADGWYTTHLTQQETLMTDDKLMVWRPNAEDIEDRSLNQRHDFYLVKKLTIPENLATGKYFLTMNVADKINGKKSIMTLPIEIK